jgi:uncharacterized circularly permuted ATP-grasp superfamily protein
MATIALRDKAITEYHEMLAADENLTAAAFARLRSLMSSNRLLYGERPIGVSLRPHLLARKQYETLVNTSESVASALEKIAAALVESPSLMNQVGLTRAEAKLALVDPGFSTSAITTRLDAFVHCDEVKFVEYNAENPSSLSDQEGLNHLLFEVGAMQKLAQRYRICQFSPVERLLEALLKTYNDWGGTRAPNIAILDWQNLPTSHEFIVLRNYFAAHGVPTVICSPDDLEYKSGELRCGDFRVDLVYKRIIIHEFLARYDETHPLVCACVNHDVCLVNPFRCRIMDKKAVFEMLTDEEHREWFTGGEREAICCSVPWTRRVADRRTHHNGRAIDLLEFVRKSRARLVLKPNDHYSGHGICVGSRSTEGEWNDAIETALGADYVVQEAIELRNEEFPIFGEKDWSLQPMFVDTSPFLFRGRVCGAMVRLSESPIVNVSSGGGETGFFVIEGEA